MNTPVNSEVSPPRILIVDDNPLGRDALADILSTEHADLLFAENGRQAVEIAQREIPDLILLDVMMPVMDGYDACRHLRADKKLAEVPVLMISALDDRASRLAGLEAGADDFIAKPFDRIELRARVRTINRLNRYRRLRDEQALRENAEREQEKLRQQLFQAQNLESIGRLAGGVAHDFNNTLAVILGYAEMCRPKMVGNVELLEYNDEIRKAGEHAASLTRQLLAFARKQVIIPRVLDLNATIPEMLKMLGRLVGENVMLHWLPCGEPLSVMMDPTQVDQILANLCVNARDAIANTGNLTIELTTLSADDSYCQSHAGATPGEYAVIVVSDDGCGIPEKSLDKIFEPFYTTKEVGRGTGLGLATVYGIVKQNKGFINVYSELGQGTTFRVYLPLCQHVSSECVAAQPTAPIPGGNETLLVVEDNNPMLQLAERVLRGHGYNVLSASLPSEALALAAAHAGKISLLVTDVVMPEMNGSDLAHALHRHDPGMRCLYMSGYTADTITRHGVLAKGTQFLSKPFTVQALLMKVRAALDQVVDFESEEGRILRGTCIT